MRYILLGLVLVYSNGGFGNSAFNIKCKPIMSGHHSTINFDGTGVTYNLMTTGSIGRKVLDYFNVPEINRKAYENYLISVTFPTESCSEPSSFFTDIIYCKKQGPVELTLRASTEWEYWLGNTFNYEHKATANHLNLTVSQSDIGKRPNEKITLVKFELRLDRLLLGSAFNHECYSACSVNKIDLGRTRQCGL